MVVITAILHITHHSVTWFNTKKVPLMNVALLTFALEIKSLSQTTFGDYYFS